MSISPKLHSTNLAGGKCVTTPTHTARRTTLATTQRTILLITPVVQQPKAIMAASDGNMADLMPSVGLNNAAGRNRNSAAASHVVLAVLDPRRIKMTKTILIALACAAGAVSMAQAQTSGSAGAGGSGGVGNTGSHGTYSGGASGGVSGGGNVVTPPGSAGAGASGGASGGATVNQPSIDTNQAQQPGVGVGTSGGASGGATIRR
jgi:hypothetical protein